MMYKIVKSVLITCILLQACSTVQSDFEVARRTDRIAAYKEFLTLHPQSEHTEWVDQRIAELKEKNEQKKEARRELKRQQTHRENETRFSKLLDYKKQLGVITDKHFLENDGWTLAKNDGKIGIVGVVKNDKSSEFSLGMLRGIASDPVADVKTAEWIKDAEGVVNATVMQGLKENREYSYLPPQEDYKVLCSLTFAQEGEKEARVLSGLLCKENEN